jgi:outer membrane receptor protein involved in Fe transport
MKTLHTSLARCSTLALAVATFQQPAIAAAVMAQEPPATAQDQGATTQNAPSPQPDTVAPGDIVVTASRRSEALSRVPISVSAFSQKSMDQLAVKDVSDVGRISPGLTFRSSTFGGSTNISIRGITSNVGASTTGIYIDDTPIQARFMGTAQAAGTTYPTVFDLERVEVLRGPQGTLFGAGSEGGTVRFLTPAPGLTKYSIYGRSELSFTEHGDPSYETGLAVGGPIIKDRIGFRVSAFYRRDGGYVDRVPFAPNQPSDFNSNYGTTLALRGALTFAPTDNFKITPALSYQRRYSNDTGLSWVDQSDFNRGIFHNGFLAKQPSKDRFILPSIKAELDLKSISIFANSSYYDRKYPSQLDYSSFTLDLVTPLAPNYQGPSYFYSGVPSYSPTSYNFGSQKSFTQEVRVQSNDTGGRLNWVIGGFYQHSKQSFDQYVYDPQLPLVTQGLFGAPPAAVFGVPLAEPGRGGIPQGAAYSFIGTERTLDQQLAGFGQAEFRLFDGFKIIAGARIAKTKFTFANAKSGPFNGGTFEGSGEKKETPVTPKFGINYEPVRGQLFYATAAKGFRTGGANSAVTNLCARDLAALGIPNAPPTYKSDSVWSYEVGTKNRFLDNKLRVEASAFLINWSDIQQEVKLGTCGFDFIANLGKVRSKGFDIQVTAEPIHGLSLSGSASYTHARFTENAFGGANNTGLLVSKGDPLAIPAWHVTGSADYAFPVNASGMEAYLHGDYQYESSYQSLPSEPSASADPLIDHAEATHFATIRAGLRTGTIDASIFVRNLFNSSDELFLTRNNLNSDLVKAATLRPRTIGVTVSFRQ